MAPGIPILSKPISNASHISVVHWPKLATLRKNGTRSIIHRGHPCERPSAERRRLRHSTMRFLGSRFKKELHHTTSTVF
jgi:hypothetical protein